MISQIKQKGFTIVELLIVIVVIGILAAISIVAYNGVTQKARDDQRISDARNIINAAASYQAEIGSWPTRANLTGYNTVKLSGTAASRLTDAEPDEDHYQYVRCGTTGVSVSIHKESLASGEESPVMFVAGTCPPQ